MHQFRKPFCALPLLGLGLAAMLAAQAYDYRVLATSKTSTMEREMNQAAGEGFTFGGVMGGESAVGGKEVIVVMKRSVAGQAAGRQYLLLATARTATLQRELQEAGAQGFRYCGQTAFESSFGPKEVSVILEKSAGSPSIEYKLLATSKTSTMERELQQAGQAGYEFLGLIVGKTALGGNEVLTLLQKVKP